MTRITALPQWLRVSFALFAVAWGGNEFTPLLVFYRHQDNLSAATVDMLLGAYVLGIVPAMFVGGPASDRWGRRPLMLPATALGVLGSLTLAFANGSAAILFVGRVFSGLALGLVMVVGTSWIRELSEAPWDPAADDKAGARRASIAMTAGFGLGAAVAAALAQFSSAPSLAPYAVNVVVTVAAALVIWPAAETRAPEPVDARPSFREDLRIPPFMERRFLTVVLPMAPWVFGSAATAYAILPGLLASRTHGMDIAFAGLLCLVALGAGVAIQPITKRLDADERVNVPALALIVTAVAMALAALAAATNRLTLATVAAAVLGAAYGMLLVSGLAQVQQIAGPDDLAGLTAVYYALAYSGFFVPMALAVLNLWWTYPIMIGAGCILAALCAIPPYLAARRSGNVPVDVTVTTALDPSVR